ncbi:hypothetical protein L202_06424 [Cryptococcus amylolentus CBS 6039]|uniref:RGS domain-containing protein n=2 Tax=Cryptococcus amylolentus TaxID=104669 RepID=A0A1E3HFW6_9TREE|nr:hypothetical protein L202_06424 [Cryptococcus amylolentus CBS 6039]ODN75232.1 hypothetical protein L202_06424 [Cryptococcus amylolentus CBS 6039]ODO03008.1 hypothetical protein I350_05852 [Cryptococcus amylolentus CBS 6273]
MADVNEKIADPKAERRASTTRYLKLNRLPTLQEVLDRRTRPPLDLFCFYIFLQREMSEDALDFWLDVQQHENLCKAYFKDLRRSGRSVQDEWPQFADYARSNGSHFSPLLSLPSEPPSPNPTSPNPLYPVSPDPVGDFDPSHSPLNPSGSRGRRDTESHGPNHGMTSPTPSQGVGAFGERAQKEGRTSLAPTQGAGTRSGRRRSKAPTVIARDRAIEKQALQESAERIFYRYLFDGGEREIYLPPSLRVYNFPESIEGETSPLIPDLFHAQKIYVFKALEQDAFPRFLRAKAFANLTPFGSVVRLIAGLLCLWGAFVLAFSLIFLDWKPRLTRLWLILPFLFAFILLLSSYYSLSPLLFLLNLSETTPFHFISVKEPYVRKLVAIRAGIIIVASLLLTAIFVVIFTVVPGHRL